MTNQIDYKALEFKGNKYEYEKAIKIMNILEDNNYEAYIVGGAVRDYLLDLEVDDFDIVTNCPTNIQEELFKDFQNIKLMGKKFQILFVDGIEIAQYRGEKYEDNAIGRPEVFPVTSAKEDSNRRDFTVNAFYFSPIGEILDFHNGKEDLANKVLRAIGNPQMRFNEDASRLLRALYLSLKLNFEIESNTKISIKENAELVLQVPTALRCKIFDKVIGCGKFSDFIGLLNDYNLFEFIFPNSKFDFNNPFFLEQINKRYSHNKIFLYATLYEENLRKDQIIRDSDENSNKNSNKIITEIKEDLRSLNISKEDIASIIFLVENSKILISEIKSGDFNTTLFLEKIAKKFKDKKMLNIKLNQLFIYTKIYLESIFKSSEELIANTQILAALNIIETEIDMLINNNYYYQYELPITGSDVIEKSNLEGKEISEFLNSLLYKEALSKEECLKRLDEYQKV